MLNINFSSNFTADNQIFPGNGVLIKDYGNKLNSVCLTPENVKKIINKLKSYGSSGPDKFSGLLFKNVVNEISYPLSCIFNISMSTSSIPAIWKTEIITSIFKNGCPNEASNYRPISLTCIASKIMEAIIIDRRLDHLITCKLISSQQHGFLVCHPTNTQLLESCIDWAVLLSNIKQVDIAYLDFTKEFDSVVHNKLMFKLNAYGFDGLLYSWIREFISNRYQCFTVENCVSCVCNVINGVPQGSVVGHYYFITILTMLQIPIIIRLLSIYLQMTPNFIPVLITLKM